MARVLLRHSQFWCFLFLALCIFPTANRDSNRPTNHHERWKLICTLSDLNGRAAPSFTLESLLVENSLSLGSSNLNQGLHKSLWALQGNEEEWHGELLDIQHRGESISSVFLSHKTGKSHDVTNSFRFPMCSSDSTDLEETRNGKFVPKINCIPNQVDSDSRMAGQSTTLKAFHLQSLFNYFGETLVEKVQVVLHSAANRSRSMVFQVHNQCAWPHKGSASSPLYFLDNEKVVQSLELSFNSSLFPFLKCNTMKEHITKLLDERATGYACNQQMSGEFFVRNMRTFPLQVHSLMIKGSRSGTNGFKVENFGDFYLGPGQSTGLQVSYWPDFRAGIAGGELQLITSIGIYSVALKANIPTDVQNLCHHAALMIRAKRMTLQVCSLALFLVLMVFGRMLKKEGLDLPDINILPISKNTGNISQRACQSSIQQHVSKQSSLYVSIDIGCAHEESKQCGLSLMKFLDIVQVALNSLAGLKVLSHPSNVRQAEMNIMTNKDFHRDHSSDTTSPTSCIIGKSRDGGQSRACIKPAPSNRGAAPSVIKRKSTSMKKLITEPHLELSGMAENTEPKPYSAAESERPRENTKQRKKKKGLSSTESGPDIGSDSGSASSLSMPSSPVTREAKSSPGSPLGSKSRAFIQPIPTPPSPVTGEEACRLARAFTPNQVSLQNCEVPVEMSVKIMKAVRNEVETRNSPTSWSLRSNLSGTNNGHSQEIENPSIVEDSNAKSLPASYSGNFVKNLFLENKSSVTHLDMKSPTLKPVKIATLRNRGNSTAVSRARCATLTTSATFPAPGKRSLHKSSYPSFIAQNHSTVGTSSSTDLVSTSMMAPQCRAPGSLLAPGSPLSPKHLPFPNEYPPQGMESSSSPRYVQPKSFVYTTRSSQLANLNSNKPYSLDMVYRHGSNGFNPEQRRELNPAQKRQDSADGSDSPLVYDIWGDHFADLARRWGPYWVGKDIPISRKASSLPPLLKTPPFSVFSSNDPLNR